MAKTAEETSRRELVDEIRRELAARRGTMTNAEVFGLLRRLPARPSEWTSADVIRELRGPLPEDDPDFANVDRH
jgi:hypothetical protein